MKDAATGVRHLRIPAEDAGQRVDNYLARILKGVPRGRIYRMLRKGEVRVGGGRVRPTYRLQEGDELRVPPVRTGTAAPPPRSDSGAARAAAAAVIHAEPRFLIVDKPAGMAAHGGSGISAGLIEALRAVRPEGERLELVHRLDRDTSGLTVVAARRSALRALHEAMREGRFQKAYLALLRGRLPEDRMTVDAPLARTQRGGERYVRVDAEGQAARTEFRVLQRFADATLVEVEIFTGRTHQIRVHAAHLGHPVAGDPRYGDEVEGGAERIPGLGRMFLHAHRLGFPHPADGEPQVFDAPLPEALRNVLDRLEAGERA